MIKYERNKIQKKKTKRHATVNKGTKKLISRAKLANPAAYC